MTTVGDRDKLRDFGKIHRSHKNEKVQGFLCDLKMRTSNYVESLFFRQKFFATGPVNQYRDFGCAGVQFDLHTFRSHSSRSATRCSRTPARMAARSLVDGFLRPHFCSQAKWLSVHSRKNTRSSHAPRRFTWKCCGRWSDELNQSWRPWTEK